MNGQLSIIQSQSSFFVPTLQTFSNMIVENADDGVEVSMIDVATVENIDNALVAAHGLSRSCLYWMRQKKGYLILGFESFEKYGEARFGFSRVHLNRLADAHAIQNVIEPIGSKEIKESVLRPLGQVPYEMKVQIWNDATAEAKAENKKVTAKMIEEAVKKYKAKNEQLQTKLSEVENDMQARFDDLQDKQLALINNNEKIISERVSIVSERFELANKNLSESLVKEKNQKSKLEKEILALKENYTTDNRVVIENAEAYLDELNIQIESKKELLEKMTSDYETNHEITSYCETLREQMAIVIAQLQGVKGVTKDLYEETNAQIHNTAEMLEQFAQQLRNFATDNAEFSMI